MDQTIADLIKYMAENAPFVLIIGWQAWFISTRCQCGKEDDD